MFVCQKCGTQSAKGEPSAKLVINTRKRIYPPGEDQQSGQATFGTEIVTELTVCLKCKGNAK